MPPRASQILLVGSILWLSWLMMMLIHEAGHVAGAMATGGTLRRVVWHPAVLSRTDVQPNPHPLIEVWAGPVVGIFVPLIIAGLASFSRLWVAYLIWAIAGFCLIANGAYIGVGAIDPVGDARELIAHGTPRWLMIGFGVITVAAGFWIWNRISPKLGFGGTPSAVNRRHAVATFAIAIVVTAIGFAIGDRGL